MRTRPSCFTMPFAPSAEPMRDPRSKRTRADCAADMAAVMMEIANHNDGTVTKDDLHRAGFSNGEIDHCHVDAVRILEERRRPRQVDQDIALPEAA